MPVGVAILDQPHPQPDDRLHTERITQRLLDPVARQRGVAVGMQQALLGHEQRPGAVAEDRAALEHDRRRPHLVPERRGDAPADLRIAIERQELLAPGVEAEMNRNPRPVGVVDVDRTGVAQPGVIERQLDDVDSVIARRSRQRQIACIGGDHRHRLEPRNRIGDGGVIRSRLLEQLPPKLAPARPPHQGALVGLPFRRHPHATESLNSP